MPPVVPAPAPAPRVGVADFLVLLFGLLLTAGGLVLAVLATFLTADALSNRQLPAVDALQPAFTAYVGAELVLVLGVPLLLAGLSRLLTRMPRRFGLGPWWAWLWIWPLVLVGGQALMLQPARNVPPALVGTFLFAGILFPVVALVAWIGPRLAARGFTWRGVWLHLVSGATLATSAAMVVELVGFLVLGAIIFVVALMVTPDASARLQELMNALSSGQLMQDDTLTRLMSWPPFAILLALTLSGLAPLAEELLKPISVLFRLLRRRNELDPGAAFLLGTLCGAGFALVEGSLYAPNTYGSGWWLDTVARAGGTLLHSFNAGLVAWGWAELIVRRRGRRWLLAIVTALALHGAWNGAAVLLSFTAANPDLSQVLQLVYYAVLTIVTGAGLLYCVRRIQRSENTPGAAITPPPAS